MSYNRQDVRSAISLIESLHLPHPYGPLLSTFITEAVDPTSAAQYVNARLASRDASSLISDWTYIIESASKNASPPEYPDPATRRDIVRRDGGRCCVTGKAGLFWDRLEVSPIIPFPSAWLTDKPEIFDMLGAFFGPSYRDWWISYLRRPSQAGQYHRNHWLVRRSVSKAMEQGFIRLDRMRDSMVEFTIDSVLVGPSDQVPSTTRYALLADHSRSGLPKIDARFVGSHARLCRGVRYLAIAENNATETLAPVSNGHTKWHTVVSGTLWSIASAVLTLPARVAFSVWLFFPGRVRAAAYAGLRTVGAAMYGGPEGSSTVQRLPFGLYLKYNGNFDGYRNEFHALKTVRKHTSIPVPEPLDVVSRPRSQDDSSDERDAYLLTRRMPGIPLSKCYEIPSDGGLEQLAADMKYFLGQLRNIPKTVNPTMAICNTLGEPCIDPRVRGEEPVGPFPDEESFNKVLRHSDDPARLGHKVYFTHADINPRNILVNKKIHFDGTVRWEVSAIVDWENSGYFPEYWDCTKSLFERFRWTERYNDWMKKIFTEFGDYSKEIDVEIRSWEMGDGI